MTNPDMRSGHGLTIQRHTLDATDHWAQLVGGQVDGWGHGPDADLDAWIALLEHLTPDGGTRSSDRAFRQPPVTAIRWRLAAGAVVPPHNHPSALGMSVCLEGECRVRHFDVHGDAPAPTRGGDFRLRETHNRLLRPGIATSLTPMRDNVHAFEAGPHGAAGVDLMIPIPAEGAGRETRDWSLIELGRALGTDFDRIYSARWIGKELARDPIG